MNTKFNNSLKALKKASLFRARGIYNDKLIDLASNDYLGLGENKKLLTKTYKSLLKLSSHAPKASMLVNGYNIIHQKFENLLSKTHNFESAIVVGSGFLANIAMFEALARKGDTLFVDEQYHASGVLASKLTSAKVIFFNHNNIADLIKKYSQYRGKDNFIAIEGIYSMSGDMATKSIFNFARANNLYLIVDEAHSSGVIGNNLLGIYDYYNIQPSKYDIKMGTLGKAYGSYGAYILSSKEIISYLENRAKPIIYSTAPSLFDIEYAYFALKYIIKNREKEKKKRDKKIALASKYFKNINGLILDIEIANNKKVLKIQQKLKKSGFIVGAIRTPTVQKAIIRVILRTNISIKDTKKALKYIKLLTLKKLKKLL